MPKKTGVVLGRFMPPHKGHCYLIDVASAFVDELHVFVCSVPRDSIPGELRVRWMLELAPHTVIHHITEENPQASRDQPTAPAIWARAIAEKMGSRPDYVFASESYGWALADQLQAKFIPVDPSRHSFPISASQIRSSPAESWDFIPAAVRPYFAFRVGVCDFTASRLTEELAAEFHTLYSGDYDRFVFQLATANNLSSYLDIAERLRVQHAIENALLRQCNRMLIVENPVLFRQTEGTTPETLLRTCEDLGLQSLFPQLIVVNGTDGHDPNRAAQIASLAQSMNIATLQFDYPKADSLPAVSGRVRQANNEHFQR